MGTQPEKGIGEGEKEGERDGRGDVKPEEEKGRKLRKECSVVQNSHESKRKYWAFRLYIRSHFTHSLAPPCSLRLPACSLTCMLTHSLSRAGVSN